MPLLPPHEPTPASYPKDKDALWREVRALWRRLQDAARPGGDPKPVAGIQTAQTATPGGEQGFARSDHIHEQGIREVLFAFAGTPRKDTISPAYYAWGQPFTLAQVHATLVKAGTADSTLYVHRVNADGTTARTVTLVIPAGVRTVSSAALTMVVDVGTGIAMEVAPGTGAESLTVHAMVD